MKNRITELFERKKEKVLSVFFTAGYPVINSTMEIIELLEKSGADLIEIGMPFSDPLADGPTIQKSSEIALKNGMSIQLLFEQVKDVRQKINIPIVLMGYLNPVMQFGMEKFVQKCKETGIDGIILPDLPPEIFKRDYQNLFEENNLSKIFLITPETNPERVIMIDKISSGFIYLVSSSGTTGKQAQFEEEKYKKINSLTLANPLMIGFGISDNASFNRANDFANGAIIGTAFIREISEGNLNERIPAFIKSVLTK